MNIEQLNTEFGKADRIRFVTGKGGFPFIEVTNERASALVSIYAGQVLAFRPAGLAEDLLFLSDRAYFQQGKAIKGGIPICWPWFGPDPEALGRPAHGFVRNRQWSVLDAQGDDPAETRLLLGLNDSPETREIWPYAFEMRLEIRIGSTLGLALMTRNRDQRDFTITQALHTYFKVGDIAGVEVRGLEGKDYLDKVDDGSRKIQSGAVSIVEEVDRIYLDAGGELCLDDPVLQRRIRIVASGSKTAVVWNPWARLAEQMADLDAQDYRQMLCVETANAADDKVIVVPAGEHRLQVEYRIEPRPG